VTTSSTKLPSLVLLVRHGATEWSLAGRHTGRTDVPLTELGVQQATKIRPLITELLKGETPLVFTSPLLRARDTAAHAMPDVSATVDDTLVEYDYGDFEGHTTSEILAQNPGWELFSRGCPGGEQPAQVAARCDAFSATLHREAAGRAVVAFTHGHLSRVLTARLLNLPVTTATALFNETASVSVINVHRGRWVLVGWNIQAR
jgi:broad specificity phosphatase PhoE